MSDSRSARRPQTFIDFQKRIEKLATVSDLVQKTRQLGEISQEVRGKSTVDRQAAAEIRMMAHGYITQFKAVKRKSA